MKNWFFRSLPLGLASLIGSENRVSFYEQRMLAVAPRPTWKSLWDGSYLTQWESALGDRLPGREKLLEAYTRLNLTLGRPVTNALEMFLWMSFDETRCLDLRHYDAMSCLDYVKKYQPDLVLCVRDETTYLASEGNGKVLPKNQRILVVGPLSRLFIGGIFCDSMGFF